MNTKVFALHLTFSHNLNLNLRNAFKSLFEDMRLAQIRTQRKELKQYDSALCI
jgi:hypothetical protein